MQKICQTVHICRVLKTGMESKLLDQDVDVVLPANKGIYLLDALLVGLIYKILMETG